MTIIATGTLYTHIHIYTNTHTYIHTFIATTLK